MAASCTENFGELGDLPDPIAIEFHADFYPRLDSIVGDIVNGFSTDDTLYGCLHRSEESCKDGNL